jgi:hypothetical protein
MYDDMLMTPLQNLRREEHLDFWARDTLVLDMSIRRPTKPLCAEHPDRLYGKATAQGMSEQSCIEALAPTYAR